MKKMHLIMFAAVLLLITACAEQDSNDDLYAGNADNPGYSAGHYVLHTGVIFENGGRLNGSISSVSQTEYDRIKDNQTALDHEFEEYGNRNFNLLLRWKNSIVYSDDTTKMYAPTSKSLTRTGEPAYIPIPEQLVRQNTIPMPSMSGVSFPHEAHRHLMWNISFMGKDGKHFTPIPGCGACHTTGTKFHTYNQGPAAIFMQDNFTKDNKTIQGASLETNPAHAFCWNSCHTKIAEPTVAPKTTDCNSCHRIQTDPNDPNYIENYYNPNNSSNP